MSIFQAWAVTSTPDMLRVIKNQISTDKTWHRGGITLANDANGRACSGDDENAVAWSPIGAWQLITKHMPVTLASLHIIVRSQNLMNEAAEQVSNRQHVNISTFANDIFTTHDKLMVAFDVAIEKATKERSYL